MILLAGAGAEPTPQVEAKRAVAARVALTLTWRAPWLGREWVLTDSKSPVRRLKGASPTGMVDPTHWWSESALIDGSSWDGMRTGRGQQFHPLLVHADTAEAFRSEHDAFMASLDPRQEGYLRYTHPDGSWREAGCRYEAGADLTIDIDPVFARMATYGITWATADPFWSGAPVVTRFAYSTTSAFFPGPPFALGDSNSLATSQVSNPGDVEAYPVWRVHGPFTAFSVGVGDSLVSLTLTKAADEWVEIDMRPRQLTIVDDEGDDQWLAATAAEFVAIPAGATVDLVTAITGASAGSAVELEFVPKYRRAW